MKFDVVHFFPLFFLLLICRTASAQTSDSSFPSFLIGPVLSGSWNDHTGSFHVPGSGDCPTFDNGSGFGLGVGVSAEFRFNSTPGKRSGISPGLTYEERPAESNERASGPGGEEERSSRIDYSLLNMQIMYRQEIAQIGPLGIGIQLGPAFQYVLNGRIRQIRELQGETQVCFDGEIPGKRRTRFFAKAGVEFLVGLGNNWIITPGIYYERGLTGVLESGNAWRVHSLIMQMGVFIPML